MTWVAWRQHRTVLFGALAFIVLVAGWLIWLRLRIDAAVDELGLAACIRQDPYSCPGELQEQLSSYSRVGDLTIWGMMGLLIVPVLVGVLVGATVFARDYEQRTHVFSLTQTTSRTRWWATKTAVLGVPLTLAMVGLGLLVTWARTPVRMGVLPRLWTPMFQSEGVALGAYFLLAFALATALGLLLRSMMPTIVVSLIVYAVVFGGLIVIRPHLSPADQLTAAAADLDGWSALEARTPEDAWIVSGAYYDANGNQVTLNLAACQEGQYISTCYLDQGAVEQRMTVHPPSHFWPLQLLESALLAVLSAAALIGSLLSLRRRAL